MHVSYAAILNLVANLPQHALQPFDNALTGIFHARNVSKEKILKVKVGTSWLCLNAEAGVNPFVVRSSVSLWVRSLMNLATIC